MIQEKTDPRKVKLFPEVFFLESVSVSEAGLFLGSQPLFQESVYVQGVSPLLLWFLCTVGTGR